MEKLTINQGMLKVAELERNYRYKSPNVLNRKKASITYILESDGKRLDCDERFDFKKELDELILFIRRNREDKNSYCLCK